MSKFIERISDNQELQARFLVWKSLTDNSVKTMPTEKLGILAKRYKIPANNRAFASDLLNGIIKRRLAIDNIIEKIAKRNVRNIKTELLAIIRLGAYQLLFEENIPDFAAIDTSCNLAKMFAKRKQIGFINAVLRTIQRCITNRNITINNNINISETDKQNLIYILPIDKNKGIQFSRQILPEPTSQIDGYLALAYSYPKWLIKRWLGFWNYNQLKDILSAGNAKPAIILRPNRIKLKDNSAEKLAESLRQERCSVKILKQYQAVMLISAPAMTSLKAYKNGLFQVQDPTASMLAENLELNEQMKILDLCAGLGTKTTQIAEITNDKAIIYATDKNADKLHSLNRNAQRLGLKSIKTISLDELNNAKYKNYFDVIILDVPCTNSGVFDRRPEARWRIKQKDFELFSKASLGLLEFAQKLLNESGQLGFSTCSIDKQENEYTIEQFIRSDNFNIIKHKLTLPNYDDELNRTTLSGGYYCILKKEN